MINMLLSCPDCNKQANVKLGQVEQRNNLAWFRSWHCDNCGLKLEESGDEIPEELRETIIRQEGNWVLIITEMSKGTLAFKTLKDIIGISLQDIAKIKTNGANCVYVGTKAEVDFYQRQCKRLGLELSAKKNADY